MTDVVDCADGLMMAAVGTFCSIRYQRVAWLAAVAFTQVGVPIARADVLWSQWTETFIALARSQDLSDVTREAVPTRFAALAKLEPDPRSRCNDTFLVAGATPELKGGRIDMLAEQPEECDSFRFGMASLVLADRSVGDLADFRRRLTAAFGEPSHRKAGAEQAWHWQVLPGRAVELQYDLRHVASAGLTLVDVPLGLQPHQGAGSKL